MWKIPAKKRTTRIVSASAVKRVLDLLSVYPPTHLKMFGQKRNTHKLLRSNHPYYRNVAKHLWENLRLLNSKILSIFGSTHLWTHTFCNVVCQVTLPCVSYRLQFTISTSLCCYSFRAEFLIKWFYSAHTSGWGTWSKLRGNEFIKPATVTIRLNQLTTLVKVVTIPISFPKLYLKEHSKTFIGHNMAHLQMRSNSINSGFVMRQ